VYAASYILPGVHVDGFGTAIVVAIVLGIVNGFIRPVLLLFTLPINVMTLGLFTLVIIGVCVLIVDAIVPGFSVDGFLWALIFAAVLAVISGFLHSLTATTS
jgi:putative membrane protein